jgi:hypothetical protein
MGKQEKPA